MDVNYESNLSPEQRKNKCGEEKTERILHPPEFPFFLSAGFAEIILTALSVLPVFGARQSTITEKSGTAALCGTK